MKKINLLSGFFVFLIVTIISCQKSNTVSNEYEVVLQACGAAQSNKSPYICFDSVLTDSRCPLNVNCPFIGYALVLVSFNENDNVHQFKMALQNYPNAGFTSDTTINGYRVIFSDLKPYPDRSKPAPLPSEMKATFSIAK